MGSGLGLSWTMAPTKKSAPNNKQIGVKRNLRSSKKGTTGLKRLSFNVTTGNRFDQLNNDVHSDASANLNSENNPKIAPIVITNNFDKADNVLSKLNLKIYFKLISIGKKVFVKSIEDKELVIKALNDNKIEFFTHPDNEGRIFKVILSGLPTVPIDTLLSSLSNENNLQPTKIVQIGNNNNPLYLLHFNKEVISLGKLRPITVVFNHIIKWMPYRPRKRGPTQCFNCTMYGHGAANCKRPAVCLLCSKSHNVKECPIKNKEVNSNSIQIFTCYNCLQNNLPHNHKANDYSCPARTKYIDIRNKRANGINSQQRKPPTNTHHTKNEPSHKKYVMAPTPPALTTTYANAVRQNVSSVNLENMVNDNTNNNLWSLDEISNILINSLNDLAQCKSKLDQMKVITKLLQNVLE